MELNQIRIEQSEPAHIENIIWDGVIIGAGPAGATAAFHLAKHGYRILLLDKWKFPREKVCGDGLIADTLRALDKMGLTQTVRQAGRQLDTLAIYSHSCIGFEIPGNYITLPRTILDALIVQQAVIQGACFAQGAAREIAFDTDRQVIVTLQGRREPVRARVGIIATGASIELCNNLGMIDRSEPSGYAMRCYYESSVNYNRLLVSYDSSLMPGYAWIFPLRDNLYNVGCGYIYKNNQKYHMNLKTLFGRFLDHFPQAIELARAGRQVTPLKGAMIRCGLRGARQTGDKNLLSVGETIGSTFPLTGEGIGKAMETGEIAADIIHDAFTRGEAITPHEFELRLHQTILPLLRGYESAERWFSHPLVNDLIAWRSRNSRFMKQSFRGLIEETVCPREIFSLSGVLRSFIQ